MPIHLQCLSVMFIDRIEDSHKEDQEKKKRLKGRIFEVLQNSKKEMGTRYS
jgi:hypothetical protein